MEIRRATAVDVPQLARLAGDTFVETFGRSYRPKDLQSFLAEYRSEAKYRKLIGSPRCGVWVASLGAATLIAYVVVGPCKLPVTNLEESAGEVQELYVRAGHHGRSLGSRLLACGLDWLVAQRFAPLYVGVWSQNYGAQRLYERFGFTRVGEYDFPVGDHFDHEFILRRAPDQLS